MRGEEGKNEGPKDPANWNGQRTRSNTPSRTEPEVEPEPENRRGVFRIFSDEKVRMIVCFFFAYAFFSIARITHEGLYNS